MKIAVIGGGWRSEFFLRAAKALPDEFEVCGVLRRTPDKARETRERFGVPAFSRIEELLAENPGFVALCVPRDIVAEQVLSLARQGLPVIAETPAARDTDGLIRLWRDARNCPVLVAEQYFLQPYHSANLNVIRQGLLGDVVSANNSMMHGYHGLSMLRKYLDVGMENCRISGKCYPFSITRTCGREGMIGSGEMMEANREVFAIEFEGGKTAFWDFSGEQYFSYIRARHMAVQGTRGEIFDTAVRWLTPDNVPVELTYARVETGRYSNLEGNSLRGLTLGERFVYRNPFEGAALNDDEIAVAGLMRNMREHIEKGEPLCYPLQDALQDTYLSFCLEQAFESGAAVSHTQPWAESN